MDLDDVSAETVRLSNWAHIATVGADGNPDVVPVWPAWKDDTLWIFSHTDNVKVRNIAANPNVPLHWQVDESGDGVEVWGTATVDTDWETKRRLWTGVFSYNLDDFAPEALESPDNCFIAVRPERVFGAQAVRHGRPRNMAPPLTSTQETAAIGSAGWRTGSVSQNVRDQPAPYGTKRRSPRLMGDVFGAVTARMRSSRVGRGLG